MRTIFENYFRPLFQVPEAASGTPEPAAPPAVSEGSGGAPAPKRSIREELEHAVAQSREPAAKRAPTTASLRSPARLQRRSAPRTKCARAPRPPKGTAACRTSRGRRARGAAPTEPATPAPAAWTKEAKEVWAQLPPAVQAAVVKREADVQKGVDELKQRYTDLDQALAPHVQAIRQHGHTPAQAVHQMFSWFQALTANPDAAFPALIKSFNYDPRRLVPQQQPAAAQPAQPGATHSSRSGRSGGGNPPGAPAVHH